MLGEELAIMDESSEWDSLLAKMREIIECLHKEMRKRRKDVVRN
jgi:hypothetical protein